MRSLPARAWVLLRSGKRLDLLNPHPMAWDDEDLATGLARTYRWGGWSKWDLPLSVAQHSLSVLMLRLQQAPALTACERLRELLHDAEEGLLGYDAPTPLKPYLGDGFRSIGERLTAAVAERYHLPRWTPESRAAHKQADRLVAASEARHVVGWSLAEIRRDLQITVEPLKQDPLPRQAGLLPWEPWPPGLAAREFLDTLRQLRAAAAVERPASRTKPTFVTVDGGHSLMSITGEIVGGVRGEDGMWDLDGVFTVRTEEGELFKVNGWCCDTEVH